MLEANLDNIVWIICSQHSTDTLILIEGASFGKLWKFHAISWNGLIQAEFKNFICADIAYLQHLMLGFQWSREDMDIWYEILVLPQIDSAIPLQLCKNLGRIIFLYKLNMTAMVKDYILSSVIDGANPVWIVKASAHYFFSTPFLSLSITSNLLFRRQQRVIFW